MPKDLAASYEIQTRTPSVRIHYGGSVTLTAAPDGGWIATQVENGRTYTGTAGYAQAAILALIADRLGFRAVVEPKEEG